MLLSSDSSRKLFWFLTFTCCFFETLHFLHNSETLVLQTTFKWPLIPQALQVKFFLKMTFIWRMAFFPQQKQIRITLLFLRLADAVFSISEMRFNLLPLLFAALSVSTASHFTISKLVLISTALAYVSCCSLNNFFLILLLANPYTNGHGGNFLPVPQNYNDDNFFSFVIYVFMSSSSIYLYSLNL